ncbi:hypothetical protein FOA52_015327 [Chlamydomonas sp. UWO 241]|nr:hypothetical protein FOA52_015327 [Chlamydomonas sp. UWO 241]
MAVFGRATGLVLNLGKCGILPLGPAGAGLVAGAQVAGLRVLDAGVSLGVPVSAGLPPPEGVTGVCRERLAAAYTKVARFPMSSFGMAHAAATYGVSRISFRAVHCGMTPEAGRLLSRCTAVLVDQRIGPTRRPLFLALGPVARIPGRVRTAELWGAEAPLWANPLLQLELPGTQRTVEWREPPAAGGGAAGEPQWVGFAHGPGVVGKLTCKLAVALQLRAVVDERRMRRAATVEAALALDHGLHGGPRATDAQVCAGLRGLEAAVPALWRVPLLNARKEPIWRLSEYINKVENTAAQQKKDLVRVRAEKKQYEATVNRVHAAGVRTSVEDFSVAAISDMPPRLRAMFEENKVLSDRVKKNRESSMSMDAELAKRNSQILVLEGSLNALKKQLQTCSRSPGQVGSEDGLRTQLSASDHKVHDLEREVGVLRQKLAVDAKLAKQAGAAGAREREGLYRQLIVQTADTEEKDRQLRALMLEARRMHKHLPPSKAALFPGFALGASWDADAAEADEDARGRW